MVFGSSDMDIHRSMDLPWKLTIYVFRRWKRNFLSRLNQKFPWQDFFYISYIFICKDQVKQKV